MTQGNHRMRFGIRACMIAFILIALQLAGLRWLISIVRMPEHNPLDDVYVGSAAQERIIALGNPTTANSGKGPLPASASDFYMYHGGSYAGALTYWSFACESLEDCWDAIESLNGPRRSEFQEWRPSSFAVVMDGPAFYTPELATPKWNVSAIKRGAVYEVAPRGNEWIIFYAVDYDTRRVYFYLESGGFATNVYAGSD